MTNEDGKNPVVARHLEALANAAKNYTLAEFANISGGANDFTGATSIAGGLSGLVPAPSIGDENKFLRGDGSWASISSGGGSSSGNVLGTVAATVDGGLWYELVNNAPVLKLRSGNYEYAFAYDSMKYAGSNTELVSYLPFENSATEDVCGNVWTATGNASLDSSVKKFGAASAHFPSGAYISATDVLHLSAEKWTFDAWLYLVSTSGAHGYFGLGATNTTTGIEVLASNVYIADNSGSNWATQVSTATLGWDATNTWMHVAIVKDGSSLMFFKDGVKKYTCTLQTDIYGTGAFSIGTSTVTRTGNDLYFDSVRFFEGVALWTDDFTPPTASDYD